MGLLPIESNDCEDFGKRERVQIDLPAVLRAINYCRSVLVPVSRKVVACWQWSNFVEAQQDSARRVIYVNMAETMIRLWQGGRRELVKVEPSADRKWFLDKEERGSLAERRQNSSMIAFYIRLPACPSAPSTLHAIE